MAGWNHSGANWMTSYLGVKMSQHIATNILRMSSVEKRSRIMAKPRDYK